MHFSNHYFPSFHIKIYFQLNLFSIVPPFLLVFQFSESKAAEKYFSKTLGLQLYHFWSKQVENHAYAVDSISGADV